MADYYNKGALLKAQEGFFMIKLESFMLHTRSLPLGKSLACYGSHESQVSFKKAMANLKGMVGLRVESVAFDVELDKDEREWVHISGMQNVDLSDVCSRCAERFHFSLSKRIDMTFIPAIKMTGAPIQDEIDEVSTYEEGVIDLFPSLMESIFLDIPIKPLCEEACKGLCPQCGTNLNLNPCTCPKEGGTLKLGKLITQVTFINQQ
jgi:uncharacterized metal-binding protein YceD (DUF177 family)